MENNLCMTIYCCSHMDLITGNCRQVP
uniref:Uncharacterized protein n=1 Tax=Arundo donax TaxID=35708 RepID=A0A0A9CDY9_ARUDO